MAKQSGVNGMAMTGERPFCTISAHIAAFAACLAFLFVTLPAPSVAEPLEYNGFATLKFEPFFSRIEGRMGTAQGVGQTGTVIDFLNDMGLPGDNRTFKISGSIRPLEHHLVRVYGTIPELYRGGTILQRSLQTKSFTYPAGSAVQSQLNIGTFGFGYDLDFLVGPRWFGGMNGDLKFVRLESTIRSGALQQEDTISIDELVPCIGAHGQTRMPLNRRVNVGGFARITYGVTPNYLNYIDLSTGICVDMGPVGSLLVEGKIGYELESFYFNQENLLGRQLELQRDGLVFSLEAAF